MMDFRKKDLPEELEELQKEFEGIKEDIEIKESFIVLANDELENLQKSKAQLEKKIEFTSSSKIDTNPLAQRKFKAVKTDLTSLG